VRRGCEEAPDTKYQGECWGAVRPASVEAGRECVGGPNWSRVHSLRRSRELLTDHAVGPRFSTYYRGWGRVEPAPGKQNTQVLDPIFRRYAIVDRAGSQRCGVETGANAWAPSRRRSFVQN
jgi:hypothetical protein